MGKFKFEIEALPCEEFDQWWEYFEHKRKQQEKAAKKNNTKGKKVMTI